MTPAKVRELWPYLSPEERDELSALVIADKATALWRALPGPQSMAAVSEATIIGFGGAAGGGKTDLACGLAATEHHQSMILRREATQLVGVINRFTELFGSRDGYNGQDKIWRRSADVVIEFGSVPNAGDETKYQGRPHDLLVFDEATNFLAQQVRFLLGWLRSVRYGQRQRALLTFNPPTTVEGRWVIQFFAPWLDRKFPNPAVPGEIRWAASLPVSELFPMGRDLWVKDGTPFVLVDGEPCYDFDPADYDPTDIIRPMSRTFIPSRVTDNPYLMNTGYVSTLQGLPEPLRSQMLKGDFNAGITDDEWQVIPTAWVEAAQARWRERHVKGEMLTQGVDVARGGKDKTVISNKHAPIPGTAEGLWFDRLIAIPGTQTPDGPTVAGYVVASNRDAAPIMIDVIGVGASPYDTLKQTSFQTHGVNVSEKSLGRDRSGRLGFFNLRSELVWRMREMLDPANGNAIALPPDPELLADLCAFKWTPRGAVIYVLSREEIIELIGRSPDRASAVILAAIDMPKMRHMDHKTSQQQVLQYDPMRQLEVETQRGGSTLNYNPLGVR